MNYFDSEPMKYFAPPSSMSKEVYRLKLEDMASSGDYLFSTKIDGNWSRAIITPERKALQTRGISKKTGRYGEIQNKVYFWEDVCKAFKNTTVILGEIFLPGKIDRDIGSILRCLDDKALARQKEEKLQWYVFDVLCYEGTDLMNTALEERITYIPKVVAAINNPLVHAAVYKKMTSTFFEEMGKIFSQGFEGAVCYKKTAIYEPGKRGPHSWDTVKVKQEIASDIDCFILAPVPCEKNYNGGDIGHWQFWENSRTGEKLCGEYFGEFQIGGPYIPISKNYYYNWPASIDVGVYDSNGNIIKLCRVAGLTEEFKTELRDNFDEWYMCPISINGMMVSTARENISIRHPILKSIRKNDIDTKDCTLAKILS